MPNSIAADLTWWQEVIDIIRERNADDDDTPSPDDVPIPWEEER